MFSNKKTITGALLATVLLISMLSGMTAMDTAPASGQGISVSDNMEADSNRQIHPFSEEIAESDFDLDGFDKVLTNDQLEIWLEKGSGAIRVLNKDSGYIWGSLPLKDAEGLNSTWNAYGNSFAAIECFDDTGKERRYSIEKDAKVEYDFKSDHFTADVFFEEIGISFTAKVTLDNDRIGISVVENTLIEDTQESGYMLKSLTFMPFFGSSYSDSVDGYMFIPDGSGALIRFRKPANYSSTYEGRIYGDDLGVGSFSGSVSTYERPRPQVLIPVYGIAHGSRQNAFMAVAEGGDEYATILSTPALTNNPYNWTAIRFEYRQKYTMSINRGGGAGAVVPQMDANDIDPRISFYFLEGDKAGYDGMAIRYRDILDLKSTSKIMDLPLRLEVLGADKRKEFIGSSTVIFTTAEQAGSIAKRLYESGIENISLIYRCFTRNNKAGARNITRLGNGQDHADLNSYLESIGGKLLYYLDPVSANKDQINLRTQAANNLSNKLITEGQKYFYRMADIEDIFERAARRYSEGGIAMDQLSFRAYGDFTSGKEMTREEYIQNVVSLAGDLSETRSLSMYTPNQYLWRYADEMYDFPITNSQLIYESDSVPFLQIVLGSIVEMFSAPLNTSASSADLILRHIEYGMSPSYVVTNSPSMELYNTPQEKYASTCFDDWESNIQVSYNKIAEALSPVRGSRIIRHEALEVGLIKVAYDNGTDIYVNYTDTDKQAGGITIQRKDFKVVP